MKYELGTPNLVGAVSLLEALRYVEKIGGMATIQSHENHLVSYTLKKLAKLQESYPDQITLIGKQASE